ncbi:acyltransferase [bacterium]|nr:acyltransferase [bacterium]
MNWQSYRRITSTGNFINEIDSIRFIAIIAVVLFHLTGYFAIKAPSSVPSDLISTFLISVIRKGSIGVELFFVISGFILGLPFANQHINRGKKVNLRQYFVRRFTRLVPPYITVMSSLLLAHIYIFNNYSPEVAIFDYLASIVFLNNIIFPDHLPYMTGVAWSLEIEVQFYFMAPLLAIAFRLPRFRRISVYVFAVILIITANHFIQYPFKFLAEWLHFFLIGFLLAEIYVVRKEIPAQNIFPPMFYAITGIIAFIVLWFTTNTEYLLLEFIQAASIFYFYYVVLFCNVFLFFFKNPLVAILGGMCYTIYLIHYVLISLTTRFILPSLLQMPDASAYFGFLILMTVFIVVISAVVFRRIERPFMAKNWHLKLIHTLRQL